MKFAKISTVSTDYKVSCWAEIDQQRFLAEYWQKKPLLMKGGVKGIENLLSKNDIFAHACDPKMISRVIRHSAKTDRWIVRDGPFKQDFFDGAPSDGWTVLVQQLDHGDHRLLDLRRQFSLIPQYLFDDIMVSYAADGGSVGPHFDQYDVFLVQGHGKRRWKLSYGPHHDQDLLDGQDLKILKNFEVDDEFIAEPGDVLYVPPKVGHYGVSIGESVCYSIGFRMPSFASIAVNLLQAHDQKLEAPIPTPFELTKNNQNSISESSMMEHWKKLFLHEMGQLDEFSEYVLKLSTEGLRIGTSAPEKELESLALKYSPEGMKVMLLGSTRCACLQQGGEHVLYVDGERHLIGKSKYWPAINCLVKERCLHLQPENEGEWLEFMELLNQCRLGIKNIELRQN
jgi:50S ribosomal protein L16 3-hydroxylase